MKWYLELATGVVRCANVDGFSLNQSLTKLLGIEPLCISIPPPPLYKIVDTINKNQEPKCVLLKQVECLPAPFLDSLISVLSDSVVDSNLVLLMTISADMSIIYSRCSRESYTRLSIRRFEFPAPTMAMNAFLDAVTFNPHFGLRVDGKLFDELRRNFLERCFSIEQLKKMVRLAVLNFFIANEDLEFDVEEGTLHIERYVLFLHLLYDLCEGLPLQPRFIYDLHSELQSKASFFTDRDGSFWQWKSVWLTWEVEEIIEAINKLLPHVKELDTSLHAELQKLLMDMNDLGRRKSAMSEETASVDSEHSSMVCAPTTKLRSHSAMQQQMRERMALAKKLDPLSSCRQRFVKLLTKIFEIVLKPFDAVGVLSKGLLRGGESLSALTTPRIAERLEESVAGNNLHLKKVISAFPSFCMRSDLMPVYACVCRLLLRTRHTKARMGKLT
ncbi:unnamed protein product [Toxocara canis]|uniref:ORC3_N domain-containing protein n=1 Tax=Toxocara canis TaxID=6265 RepID=A0A183VDM3_TOXCA|nr:unnamed protein product [Toxocara canis]